MKTTTKQTKVTCYTEDETLVTLTNIYSRYNHLKTGQKMMLLMDSTPTLIKILSIQINGRIVYFDLLDMETCDDFIVAVDLNSEQYFSLMDIEYFWDAMVGSKCSNIKK